jgi:hypothetical protein
MRGSTPPAPQAPPAHANNRRRRAIPALVLPTPAPGSLASGPLSDREVLPHTALRHRSSSGMRRCPSSDGPGEPMDAEPGDPVVVEPAGPGSASGTVRPTRRFWSALSTASPASLPKNAR